MVQEPLISICCLAYNHELYIRECLDGFMMQKTDFPFEVLIHDDASVDGTANIIREYEAKYPDIIKPIYQTENQYSKGVGVTKVYQFPRAIGKYIAMCEGDDFWTDPYKLQKQVDLLENNSEYSACATQSQVIYHNKETLPRLFTNLFTKDTIINVIDLATIGCFFHTATIVFRTENIRNIPQSLDVLSGDKIVFFLNAMKGPIYWMSDIMSVYRKNDAGISSIVSYQKMKKDLNLIPFFKKMSSNFPVNLYLSHLHYTIFYYAHNVPTKLVLKHYLLHLYYGILSFPKSKYKLKEAQRAFKIVMKPRITQTKLYRLLKK